MLKHFLSFVLASGLVATGWPARAQSASAPVPAAASVSPTSAGAVMKKGRMMTLKEGQMVPLTEEMLLENGAKVLPSGVLLLPDGQRMAIGEGEVVKMTGMVMPAPHPPHRRVTRFNKHVSEGMMKPVR
jgi:hypothetical protein